MKEVLQQDYYSIVIRDECHKAKSVDTETVRDVKRILNKLWRIMMSSILMPKGIRDLTQWAFDYRKERMARYVLHITRTFSGKVNRTVQPCSSTVECGNEGVGRAEMIRIIRIPNGMRIEARDEEIIALRKEVEELKPTVLDAEKEVETTQCKDDEPATRKEVQVLLDEVELLSEQIIELEAAIKIASKVENVTQSKVGVL